MGIRLSVGGGDSGEWGGVGWGEGYNWGLMYNHTFYSIAGVMDHI